MHVVAQVSGFLVTTWMIVGLGGAVFLSLILLDASAHAQLDPLARFHWILLIAYLVHQFEEHGVDLLGRAYFFITYARTVIADVGAASGFQLTPLAIYRTNTLFVWLPFLAAVWGHRRFIWQGLAAGGLVLTNAVLHIGIAVWRKEYDTGVGTPSCSFCWSRVFTSASWCETASSVGRELRAACSSARRSMACSSFAFASTWARRCVL